MVSTYCFHRVLKAWRQTPDCSPQKAILTSHLTTAATLASPPSYHDSCPRDHTLGPTDTSSESTSPLWAPLGPECLVPLCQVPVSEGDGLGAPQEARTIYSEPLLGAISLLDSCALTAREEGEEQKASGQGEECPICTESYGLQEHRLALLNCGHGLCEDCLHQLLGTAPSADLGRVCCPLCRQKTPMLEWQICQLQEELLQADGPARSLPCDTPLPSPRDPGPWGSLEHRYQMRFLVGPGAGQGCLPFLPCPPRLGAWLWALREHGPCARCLVLLSLLALELLGLGLIALPLVLLGLLLMLLDRSSP
ncbi:ring finger protein-like [Nycticebus coucang]|uniref:ring finger protein-like n=1 Tax=Nycticebus coucang TaxID=9470 RepID=UPI00234C5639|nr:ring finger protein-like [Nycticebus coucang]